MIEQWAASNLPNDTGITINFTVVYTSNPIVVAQINPSGIDKQGRNQFHIYSINTSNFSVYGNTSKPDKVTWESIGY